jgi:spore coat polysaccharide biosynthesis protein SpsF
MGSSRLPGKVLREIGGLPMLGWMIERMQMSRLVDETWVATTTSMADDPIAAYCHSIKIPCFRGSEYDVLDRFYQTALRARADVVVRLTADCPFIDPELVDDVIEGLYLQDSDFCANRLPPPFHRTFPIGLDAEAVRFPALERAWREAETQYEREHVMPYFYDDPDRFSVTLLHSDEDFGQYRWTVDTPEDLTLLQAMAASFNGKRDFSWYEVVEMYQRHPEWQSINAGIHHKTFFDVDDRANNAGGAGTVDA